MAFTTLIGTDTLAGRLADPAFAIVDCRFKLDDESWGERQYLARHIPDATYAHLSRDLSGAVTGSNGRHPLPEIAAAVRTFGRWGIDQSVQVVACDQDNGMFASRLWWLLRWLGHDAVAVLDGGFAKWLAEGRPTSSGPEGRAERAFSGTPRSDMWIDAEGVARLLHDRSWRLVDARAPERYRGDAEPIDRVAGHIPGAVNRPFLSNLDDRGTFRSAGELRASFSEAHAGLPAERVVYYCGSGVTACVNLLALEHAGLSGSKLYPGSWSEWSSDPARPVETGSAK